MVLTCAAGYTGPGLFGLGAAALLAAGHAVGALWALVGLLGLLLVQIRNWYGLWSVLVSGGLVLGATWFLPPEAQAAVAAVTTWFLLLGAFGALLYRLVALCAQGEARKRLPDGASQAARTTLAILDWPVAQLMTLALALVGNFDAVFTAWKDTGGAGYSGDARFLAAAARASSINIVHSARSIRAASEAVANMTAEQLIGPRQG